jgi:hypothetical protein
MNAATAGDDGGRAGSLDELPGILGVGRALDPLQDPLDRPLRPFLARGLVDHVPASTPG